MNKTAERILLAVVLLGLFIPGAVRLADPYDSHHSAATIDDSEPPAEMAYDAMMQTERRNYTLSAYLSWVEEGNPAVIIEVDSTNHRTMFDLQVMDNYTFFQNRHISCLRYANSGYGNWSRIGSTEYLGNTFNPQPVRNTGANVTEVRRNQTTIVLRVHNNTTVSKIASSTGSLTGGDNINNLTLYIDRDDQVLRRAVFQGREEDHLTNETAQKRVVYRFSHWDETTVDRPRSVPYTLVEILSDIREWKDHHSSAQANAAIRRTVQSQGMP